MLVASSLRRNVMEAASCSGVTTGGMSGAKFSIRAIPN
jgi:hypothetical protein